MRRQPGCASPGGAGRGRAGSRRHDGRLEAQHVPGRLASRQARRRRALARRRAAAFRGGGCHRARVGLPPRARARQPRPDPGGGQLQRRRRRRGRRRGGGRRRGRGAGGAAAGGRREARVLQRQVVQLAACAGRRAMRVSAQHAADRAHGHPSTQVNICRRDSAQHGSPVWRSQMSWTELSSAHYHNAALSCCYICTLTGPVAVSCDPGSQPDMRGFLVTDRPLPVPDAHAPARSGAPPRSPERPGASSARYSSCRPAGPQQPALRPAQLEAHEPRAGATGVSRPAVSCGAPYSTAWKRMSGRQARQA